MQGFIRTHRHGAGLQSNDQNGLKDDKEAKFPDGGEDEDLAAAVRSKREALAGNSTTEATRCRWREITLVGDTKSGRKCSFENVEF